jgi:hypothetical protein
MFDGAHSVDQSLEPTASRCESLIRVHKRDQQYIRTHNEPLSVTAMRVCNPDRSPVGINR